MSPLLLRPEAHLAPTMSLEATMIVLDNSAHSLNGDFIRALAHFPPPPAGPLAVIIRAHPCHTAPAANRLQAQSDCIFTIMGTKINAHPENEVGLMVMAGKGCVLVRSLSSLVLELGACVRSCEGFAYEASARSELGTRTVAWRALLAVMTTPSLR